MVSVAESACSVISAASVSCFLVPHNQSNPSARPMTDEKNLQYYLAGSLSFHNLPLPSHLLHRYAGYGVTLCRGRV